ncbi:MAG: ferritin-like fold-containing protein [Actinomycetota bacterium]|nr:ferritin-like domain-containing protein [Actinomycetota bacterium]
MTQIPPAGDRHTEALAEVLGALAYALLRVFQLSAAATATAPSMALAEAQALFAAEELERYRALRRRIDRIAADTEWTLVRFRGPLDAFFDTAPTHDWLSVQVFQFLGDAIAADFAGLLALRIDAASAESVREALGSRAAHEAFALEQARAAMAEDPSATGRAVKVAGTIVGTALSTLRAAILESDALGVVLGGEEEVKWLVMELLANHRERLERLGIEQVE